MRLVVDVESTGLIKRNVSRTDAGQPSVIQLCAVLFDLEWSPVAKLVTLIKPNGWVIEPQAEAVHGISQRACMKYGIPIRTTLIALQGLTVPALQIVCHNEGFDRTVIEIELERLNADGAWWKKKAGFCTMLLSTPVCEIPGKYGFKWPKLEQAHEKLVPDHQWTSRHDAEDDVMATARVAKALDERGLVPDPWTAGPREIKENWRDA